MRYFTLILLTCIANIALSQVSSFPYSESFETAFTTGTDVSFISNWTGNEVATTNRIFQSSDPRTGSSSINIIPTSTFSGEVLISLDLTGINNPRITFYAFSKENGGGSSTRPVLLSFSTSIDGGNNFIDDTSIGDDTTFPNDNTTTYTEYTYDLHASASGASNVVVRITAARGSGSGSAAELVMDDFTIDEVNIPLDISSTTATSNTTVVVTFNQEVTQVTAENTNNYVIDNSISVSGATRTAINEVTLTTSTMANNNYELTVNNVEDAATTTPASDLRSNFSFVEPLSISSTTVIDENTLQVDFNLNLDETSAETTANYNVNNSIGNPTTAVRDVTNNNRVTLTFATALGDNSYELTVNNVQDVSTLATASNLTDNFSYLPLEITSIQTLSNTQVEITFNQNVESTSVNTATNYSMNFSYGNPTSAVRDGGNAAIVVLTFSSSMVNNTYTVTIDNVENTSGNATASSLQSNVTHSTATLSRQIVINEIFADPTGSAQPNPQVLPGSTSDEFIELYNASNNAIDIGNFDMVGGTVGTFVLQPNSYVILTATSNVTDFQGFGDVVGVTSWNTLTNSGEQLILRDNLGNLVDSLTYDLDWYNDVAKSDGGWTIEQINPELVCSDANNWSASTDVRGGTPGSQNSVYDTTPDTSGPNLINVFHNSSTEIVAVFDEIMDQASLNGGTYTLDNGITVINAVANTPSLRSVTLTLNPAMTSGTLYQLTVSGVTDCAGNSIDTNIDTYVYDVEAPVLQRLVLRDTLNLEMIFDEEIEQSPAETESNYSINNGIGNPSSASKSGTDNARALLTFSNPMSVGSSYTLTHQNIADTVGNATSTINTGFTFADQIDTVIVISNLLLDVYFDVALDEATAETLSNYTVDGGIGNPNSASLDTGNDQLVHLVFDNSFAENSTQIISFDDIQDSGNNFIQLFNTGFVYDTDDPDVDSVIVVDDTHLRAYFDEVLDQTSAEAINNYSANNSLGNPSLVTLQSDRTSVVLEFATAFEQEVQNTLTLTGVEDPSGNAISTNRNFDFIYDRLAPRLVGIQVTSPTTIRVEFSEEVEQSIAENVNNYSVDNGIGNPVSAVRSTENTNVVTLTFTDLGNNAVNTLTISNVSDVFENGLPVDLTAQFASNTAIFGSLSVLTDTTLRIQFNKLLNQTSAENITNYGFDNGIGVKSITQDGGDASIVNFLLNTTLIEGVNYRLVAQNLRDTDGNTSQVISYDFQYDPQITSISILTQNSILITFDEDVDETTAETTTNYSIDSGIGNPLTAVRDNVQNNEVTLFFTNALTEGTDYILSVQNVTDSFGGIISASTNSINYDASAPFVTAINSIFTNEIEVVFNEIVDQSTAQTLNHYSLDNGIGQPTSAVRNVSNPNTVTLQFSTDLTDGLLYGLTVDRVEDTQGKAIAAVTTNFTFQAPYNPAFRELIINEVYFDTDLESSVPNIEYVELYNRSSSNIQLRGLSLADSRDTATFTDFTLNAGEYITLTSLAGESSFTSFGNALGVSNFPSLSNTGETLSVLSRSNVIIDSLAYDRTFYNDNTKENGGFSIELINPDKACFDVDNFGASTDVSGGTPGTQNSIHDITPDTTDPILTNLIASTTTLLELTFNEAMDVSTLVPGNFGLQNGVNVSSITINDSFGKSISLTLDSEFTRGAERTLTLNGVADCSGNTLSNDEHTFLIGETPGLNDLLITEIMASPTPSNGLPEREYIEVYNNSSNILAIGGLQLSDDNGTVTLGEFNLYPQAYLILTSNSGQSELASYGDVLGINSFPTFTIDDLVIIRDESNNLIFQVDYDRSYYQDDTRDDGGYSIEMINTQASCYDAANWTASLNVNGGTPGIQNSVYDVTPDTSAPSLVSLSIISQTQLRATFNESMDVSSLVAGNMSFTGSLVISSVDIEDTFGTSILINLSSAFSRGISYTLTLSGLADCSGNALGTTNQNFYLGDIPGFQEIIISEIMADPSPTQGLPEVEYLELYNNSSRILSIGGVNLADATGSTTLPEFSLQPGAYLILVPFGQSSSFTSFGDVLEVPNWRNLNSSGDNLVLSLSGSIVHEVFYTDDWYRSTQKSQGGYSLEMIDLNAPCVEELNWNASENSNGGTPGSQNSVNASNPDIVGPSLSGAIATSTTEIELTFDEKIETSGLTTGNFNISPLITVSSLSIGTTKRTVTLTTDPLVQNTVYTISANNVNDCSGNLILGSGEDISLIIPTPADSLDLIVNEVLFDPLSGGVRFVEIFNNSNNYINLNNWSLAGHNNQRLISSTNQIIAPNSFNVITNDGTILKDHYPNALSETIIEVEALPNMNNTEGSISIIDNGGNVIDFMIYKDEYHSSLLSNVEGVALERIRPDESSLDSANWFSASSSDNYATPGYQNSQFLLPDADPGTINISPISFAPDEPGRPNFTTLNYTFDEPGNIVNVSVYDARGNEIKAISQNTLVGTDGFFRWDGTNDRGEKARVGYYMVLFEIITPSGKVIMKKERVALGGRF